MTTRTLSLLVLLGAAACGGSPPAATPVVNAAPASPGASRSPPVVAPLSEREQALKVELRRDVEWLAGEIGERNLEHEWQLSSAADGLAGKLESYGYAVDRTGVTRGEVVSQNLEVVIRGGAKHGAEQVVVGAHYDTHVGTPGADDNASGVAALLALARSFKALRPERSLRLVFFCNEEAPHFQTPSMGSLAYAETLLAQRAEVIGMLSLESIGYYSDAPRSQGYPKGLEGRYPDTGNFVALVANDASRSLLDRVSASMKASSSIPIVADALPVEVEGVGSSDHWSFWQVGYPALMVTDTAPFRNPHYHRGTDRPDTLDYDRFARAVRGIEAAVQALAGSESSS